jgi:hypothetical protein
MASHSSLRTPRKNDLRGQGGRRKGFASPNEIEDMQIFDQDPGKEPSQENGLPPPKTQDQGEIGPLGPSGRH